MHLGDQRAGGIDRAQPALGRLLAHLRRYPVRGEDHHGALRDFRGLFHEDRAALLQRADHVGVVHDLLAHVDGGAEALQRRLDGLHRPVYARAITARLGEQDASGRHGHETYGRRTRYAAREAHQNLRELSQIRNSSRRWLLHRRAK